MFVVAVSAASPCGAIVSNPLPRVCNEFPHSDYVFSGKVLSDTYHWHEYFRGDPSEVFRISVDRVFKGKVPHIVRLYTAADSGRGVLTTGQPAIVFARRAEGRFAFDGSSNSQSGAGVPSVISEIESYIAQPPKTPTIAGRVDGWTKGAMAPLGSVRLLFMDEANRRFVRADRRGMFLVSLSPGRWSIQIAEPGWASRSGDYTYDSAEGVRLARGGCADVELETVGPGGKLEGPYWKRWPK